MKSAAIARRALVAIGVVSLCVGCLVSFVPAAEAAIRWPWDDDLLSVAVFTVAFTAACLLGPFGVWDVTRSTNSASTVPERVPATPVPGHDLERLLDRRWPASMPAARRRRIRDQVRAAALRTIVRRSDCSMTTARRRLERGTWTDDPVAAAFVRTESPAGDARLRALVERIRFIRRARRTVRAILNYAPEGRHR